MRNDENKTSLILAVCGIVPIVWLALLTAPYVSGGIVEIIGGLSAAINQPFSITVCEDSVRTVLIFLLAYAMGIGIYLSTRRNYRRREEHGSAKWGNASALNKKYKDKDPTQNKLLTQNVRIGLDGRKHRRNLNILVCGGSGAGKTRFFCKPNAMQCNTSMVILDPKGEIVRDVGGLLEEKGYEVRVLDLINMHKSHCYNPFVYLQNDNDVQRLVTNLFKATTPKGSQSQDPFWDTAASMLLLSLVFYLKYEAPPDEQNFPMVMELLRAGEVREDDDSYVSPLDELFDRLEMVNPEHIALKYYARLRHRADWLVAEIPRPVPEGERLSDPCRWRCHYLCKGDFNPNHRLIRKRQQNNPKTQDRAYGADPLCGLPHKPIFNKEVVECLITG